MILLRWLPPVLFFLALSGCATSRIQSPNARSFRFDQDTFAYANELLWEYDVDPITGKTITNRREPKPDYTLHCFVVARSARQFFHHARFDPSLPKTETAGYRQIIRQVIARNPRKVSSDAERIVIPGFKNLREFSERYEYLLKAECGGAWQSYFQRGHWRMLFPFSRGHQQEAAEELKHRIADQDSPVVHVVRFPSLAINHAILLFGFSEAESEIRFAAYDPNEPGAPALLRFDKGTRTFFLGRNKYFAGGRVDVYEVYNAANY